MSKRGERASSCQKGRKCVYIHTDVVVDVEVQTLMIYDNKPVITANLGTLTIGHLIFNIGTIKQCNKTKMHAKIDSVQKSDARRVFGAYDVLLVLCIKYYCINW